jgi:hypothetical protein
MTYLHTVMLLYTLPFCSRATPQCFFGKPQRFIEKDCANKYFFALNCYREGVLFTGCTDIKIRLTANRCKARTEVCAKHASTSVRLQHPSLVSSTCKLTCNISEEFLYGKTFRVFKTGTTLSESYVSETRQNSRSPPKKKFWDSAFGIWSLIFTVVCNRN